MQNRRLFEYAENGDLIGVVEMLAGGADINWRNTAWFGQTALHIASANGHTEVVKTLLLHSEINPNVKDNFGWTPLHLASFYRIIGTDKELLKIPQVDYKAKAQDGWTVLHSASYSGVRDVVDELIQLPKIDINAKTDGGWTFLDIAFKMRNSDIINLQNRRLFEYAENGDLIGVVEMLAKGADINWQNPDWFGQTALHIASANGHTEVVKTLLLHSEIDPNAKDDFGWTPLHLASLYSNIGTDKKLLEIPQVDYNVKPKDGWTLLYSASNSGVRDVVDELIQMPKIDLMAKTDWGSTFLDIAFKMRHSDIINLQNRRLFEYAESGDLIGVVEMLSRGADINWRNPDLFGQTALHIASANGHTEVVKTLLLHSEIDPNAKDNFGWTPLHLASLSRNIRTDKELLKIPQVDYNAEAQDGWTVLHSASNSGVRDVVDELIQLPKIDLNAKTDWGWTFWDIAFKMRNSDINNLPNVVEVLLDEVNTLYDQLLLSQIMSDTDLAESFKKQATIAKRLETIWSQLRLIDTLIDFNLKGIEAILLNEKVDFPDVRSKMNKIIRNLNRVKYQYWEVMKISKEESDAVVEDAEDFEVGINPPAMKGSGFDDLKNIFQTTYCDDKFAEPHGSEIHILCHGGFGELKSMPTNVTSGALATLSVILLAVFAYSYIHYYQARTSKRTFQERWNIKSLPWTMTFGLISWILNMLMQALTVEWNEESLNKFEHSVTKVEMLKDKAKTADINIKEIKNHYEDQLGQLHTVYEARIRECKLEFVEKLEKLHLEIERLKTEMTKMKKKMGMLSERPINVEANPVRLLKRGRSVGHERYQLKKTV